MIDVPTTLPWGPRIGDVVMRHVDQLLSLHILTVS